MDNSNYDICKCTDGCGFWHIILTTGYRTPESAVKAIRKMIKEQKKK